MKAIVYHQYGLPDVLKLEEMEKPAPRDDEVLVKVQAVSVNGSDWEGLIGKPLYARMGGYSSPAAGYWGPTVPDALKRSVRTSRNFDQGMKYLEKPCVMEAVLPSISVRLNAGWRGNQPV